MRNGCLGKYLDITGTRNRTGHAVTLGSF